mgnify:CR=1 FL=1
MMRKRMKCVSPYEMDIAAQLCERGVCPELDAAIQYEVDAMPEDRQRVIYMLIWLERNGVQGHA